MLQEKVLTFQLVLSGGIQEFLNAQPYIEFTADSSEVEKKADVKYQFEKLRFFESYSASRPR